MGVNLASAGRLVRAACVLLAFGVLQACGGGGGGGGSSTPAPTAPVIVAPSIDTQPKAATVVDGATATFSVSASGTTLSYQWQKDGQNIAGATTASYTTAALRYADNGAKYQVVVTGPNASVTSSAVVLTVSPVAVTISTQPTAQTAKDGEVVSFDVAAKGSEPLQYQWLRNGTAIAGATQATYTTAALALADSGAVYSVHVTNPAGTVASQEAKLQVSAVAPRVITDPESVTTVDGSSVTLKVVAAGSAPLSYQWQRNGAAIAGATGTSYSTTLDYAGSGDRYSVLISNVAGKATSAAAVMTVNPAAPAIGNHPSDSKILTGEDATFTASASGTAPLRYQWQQSTNSGLTWSPISGATSSSYAVRSATLADTNLRFRVAVTNAAATLTSSAATLTVQGRLRLIAGALGGPGYAEGKGSLARFRYMAGMAVDSAGVIYLADAENEVFRRVQPDGTTSLLAGRVKEYGWNNGSSTEARFMRPVGVVVGRDGDLLLADQCSIRRLTSAGQVVDFVGRGACDFRDGTGRSASLGYIQGLVQDPDGNLFVTEQTPSNGQVIRKVSPAGVVSLFAGSATESGTADGLRAAARFSWLGRLTIDAERNLYVIDGSAIRKVTPAGDVTTYAGSPNSYSSQEGFRTAARLSSMNGLAFDAAGNLFVSEATRLSRITPAGNLSGAISYAVDGTGNFISRDGAWDTASVGWAGALALLPNGSLALLDSKAGAVRVVSPLLTVTTLAGGGAIIGFVDGVGASARFHPEVINGVSMVFRPSGLVLADAGNRRLRRISVDTGRVDTLAGTGTYGNVDGTALSATFSWPRSVALDSSGNLFVADSWDNVIRRISVTGVVTTLAGKAGQAGSADGIGAEARFSSPQSLVVDSKGNVIVADLGNAVLRRITPDGSVTTFVGKAGEGGFVNGKGAEARVWSVMQMAIDKDDNVYFTEGGFHTVRKVSPSGDVSTFAGAPYSPGSVDDVAPFARFSSPTSLAVDARGNVYVCDTGNGTVRRISPDGYVTTVLGQSGTSVLQLGVGGSLNGPLAIAVSPDGRLFLLSEGAIVGD